MDKDKYKLEKMARRRTGFPMATVAYYGPNDQFASKVVVGIRESLKQKEIVNLKKWFSTEMDVRFDADILLEMLEYIEANSVHRVALAERIIGCPHEEGIDYPMGETCPECPFWANQDRWTGEIIR
jgi:hypothetical protein